MENIFDYYIFDEEDVEEFVKAYEKGVNQSELLKLLNEPVNRLKEQIKRTKFRLRKKLGDTKVFIHLCPNCYHLVI